jgi:hypothetical protein
MEAFNKTKIARKYGSVVLPPSDTDGVRGPAVSIDDQMRRVLMCNYVQVAQDLKNGLIEIVDT